uniref:HTH CENPB-type domain-containing protein n=1 Tax=Acrobeloides nanus TaxID=290746 RepID=A0A914CZW7_9BILA
AKALELAKLLRIQNFNASNGWLGNFRKRHDILFKTIRGEAGAVDLNVVRRWIEEELNPVLNEFDPEDVYNADETGSYYTMMPNRTLAFKGENVNAVKFSKDRITVHVCANMTGSDKRNLLIIGHSRNPRDFKGNMPPEGVYTFSKKAWMNHEIFDKWLMNWDDELDVSGRKIVLFVDNFSAHKSNVKLRNITLKFLPENSTSVVQPMDRGIIRNLKFYYRRSLLSEKIKAIDLNKPEKKISLPHAIRMMIKSWDEVKLSTIQHCFANAGFVRDEEGLNAVGDLMEEDDLELEEFRRMFDRVMNMAPHEERVDAMDYLNSDENLSADEEEPTNEEIVADLTNGEMEYESENEDNDDLMFIWDAENEINQEFFQMHNDFMQ